MSLDKYGMVEVEHSVDGPFLRSTWMNKIQPAERRWVNEEFQYQSNSVNEIDGKLHFWQDNLRAWNESKRFRFRTTSRPNPFKQVYQTQVSNGAQINSFEYFDSLYIDETWHRVLKGNSSVYYNCTKLELIVPNKWNETTIEGTLRLGEFTDTPLNQLFVYVFDANGVVNSNGFNLAVSNQPTSSGLVVVGTLSNTKRVNSIVSHANQLVSSFAFLIIMFFLIGAILRM
ncbi:predicted protein [Naegleria gruberi]|uniref:Predicted protein n=1 Tax=Naegleria gruberi TaxID=5762 RepID=D2W455_NAEGR|nr:uncharacterized protein NAEGRDRAFT_76185 [Naegleria gruberi]EFC36160.1 predicted protein [Naegleria gruberi]|eukprot:XP_002668904.1 predicted protein [Naegleria gruberi strain NEG-M]